MAGRNILQLPDTRSREEVKAPELESLLFRPIEFEPTGSERIREELMRPSESLIRKIRKIGIRELVRFGCGRRILQKISRKERLDQSTLKIYERMIERYKLQRGNRFF